MRRRNDKIDVWVIPSMNSLLRKPSAWVPIALSLGVWAMLGVALSLSPWPPVPEADEGVAAHIFQLWLVLEALLIPFFALVWLPQAPRETLAILALQVAAVLPPIIIVFYFNL